MPRRAKLDSAQAQLNTLVTGPTAADMVTYQSAVTSAEAALSSAEAKLLQVQNGPTSADLAAAQAAVTQAQSQLRGATAKRDADQQAMNEAAGRATSVPQMSRRR